MQDFSILGAIAHKHKHFILVHEAFKLEESASDDTGLLHCFAELKSRFKVNEPRMFILKESIDPASTYDRID